MKIGDFINGKVVYHKEGQDFWITDKSDRIQILAELRGWGCIQNMFRYKNSSAIDVKSASEFQDKVGEFVAEAINEKLNNTLPPTPSAIGQLIEQLESMLWNAEQNNDDELYLKGIKDCLQKAHTLKTK